MDAGLVRTPSAGQLTANPIAPAEEPATPEDAVLTAMISLGRRMRQRFPEDQIDYSAFPLLKALSYDGPLRLSALAAQLELDASTVSRHARSLEDRGLLERTVDPEDRRASQVNISEHGLACLADAARTRREFIARVLEGWSDADRDRLRVLLTRFQTDLATQNSMENP